MEVMDGLMLAAPTPLEEPLPIACQIAEDLESAHEKGIIHRDFKPAGIKGAPAGFVTAPHYSRPKEPANGCGAGGLATSRQRCDSSTRRGGRQVKCR